MKISNSSCFYFDAFFSLPPVFFGRRKGARVRVTKGREKKSNKKFFYFFVSGGTVPHVKMILFFFRLGNMSLTTDQTIYHHFRKFLPLDLLAFKKIFFFFLNFYLVVSFLLPAPPFFPPSRPFLFLPKFSNLRLFPVPFLLLFPSLFKNFKT